MFDTKQNTSVTESYIISIRLHIFYRICVVLLLLLLFACTSRMGDGGVRSRFGRHNTPSERFLNTTTILLWIISNGLRTIIKSIGYNRRRASVYIVILLLLLLFIVRPSVPAARGETYSRVSFYFRRLNDREEIRMMINRRSATAHIIMRIL